MSAPAVPVPAEAASVAPAPAPATPATVDALRLWQRFHIRLTLLYGGIVFTILTLMGAAFYVRGVESEISSLQLRMRAMAVAMARSIEPADVLALEVEADAVRPEYRRFVDRFRAIAADEPLLQSIYLLRPTDRPGHMRFAADWVRSGVAAAKVGQDYLATQAPGLLHGLVEPTFEEAPYTDEWGTVISGYAPVRAADGTAVAVLGIDVKASSIDAMKHHVRIVTVALYGLSALLMVLMAVAVGRMVRGPLARIIEATTAISGGRLEARAQLDRQDEFGILGRHFDQMAIGLQEREFIRATFGRYVSEEVARKILTNGAQLSGEERVVTVMLTDIRNYSTVSEHLPPAEVVRVLNAYMSAMGELIDRHGGCVIEYLGDAILCVFGAPGEQADHAEQATRCGIAMVERLAELNREWEASGLARLWQAQGIAALGARMGIHSGRVVAGNVGSRSRVKYAVVGDAVNVAARIEALNKETGTELLVTADTLALLPETLRSLAIDLGEHPVKGRRGAVRVFTFRG